MNGETGVLMAQDALTDRELVAGTRDGDDGAFEELYRRYRGRIRTFVRGLVHEDPRAEDIMQEAFLSALRRLRATDSPIAFKPWIYEIARNAAIDSYRRTSRSEEVSMDAGELRPSDRVRLMGGTLPDSLLVAKERLDHLRGALDELSDTHHRVLVMRELEGLSYREIGERMELSRPAVESALFRARRRLEREYEELDTGRRCQSMRGVIARMAEGIEPNGDSRRLARHLRRCSICRRRARELGVAPSARSNGIASKVAALLPLPAFLRRRAQAAGGAADGNAGTIGAMLLPGAHVSAAVAERAVAVVAAAAIAGAGGAMLAAPDGEPGQRSAGGGPAQVDESDAVGAVERAVMRAHQGTQSAQARDTIVGPSLPSSAPGSGFGTQGRPAPSPAQRERTSPRQVAPALPVLPLDPDGPSEPRGDGEAGGSSLMGVELEGPPPAPPVVDTVVPALDAAAVQEPATNAVRAVTAS